MIDNSTWVKLLVTWYQENKRDLPWRKRQDPYGIWISEIMLQQTRVDTVISYYQRFMERFPTVADLAQAEVEVVLKLWEGLGYYSRAKNLHRAAQEIVQGGKGFPRTHQEVLRLPGIGRYTAGAIMSIAYNEPYPAVDGNVLRVMSRLLLMEQDISSPGVKAEIEGVLTRVFPTEASDFTQGLMELGALLCVPATPRCEACPLQRECRAYSEGKQQELPIKKAKAGPKRVQRYLALAQQGGAVLMNKRPEKGLLGGLWEFPGVEVKTPEDIPGAFEVEFGLRVTPQEHIMNIEHVFTHRIWEMKVYRCLAESVGMSAKPSLQWVALEELDQLTIPGAFQKIKLEIQKKWENSGQAQ